jgi:hypothetical protein
MGVSAPAISLRGVTKRFGPILAVDDLDPEDCSAPA